MNLMAILIALASSVLWGVGFWCTLPISKVLRPEVITLVFSVLSAIANAILMISRESYVDFKSIDKTIGLYFGLHLATMLVAAFINLWGYQIITAAESGAFTAISSTYPLVTFVLVLVATGVSNSDINLRTAVPGVLLVTVGVVLLSLRTTSSQETNPDPLPLVSPTLP